MEKNFTEKRNLVSEEILNQLLMIQELNQQEHEATEVYCGKNTRAHGH